MTFVEVSVFLKGQPVKTTSLDHGLNHMQLLYCYLPTWQVHLRAVGLVLGVWLYMERSCRCCCLCFFGSVSQRTPVTMWWHNTELCDTGSLQAGFDFFIGSWDSLTFQYMSLVTLATILFLPSQLRNLPCSFVYLSLSKWWALPEQQAAVFRSLLLLNMHNKSAAFKSHALKKKRLLLMKRTLHLPSITKMQAHRAWSKKRQGRINWHCVES